MTPSPRSVVILGTSGNSRDILDLLEDLNRHHGATVYRCIGFLDDDPHQQGIEVAGCRVLGPLAAAATLPECCFVNGIGSPGNFW